MSYNDIIKELESIGIEIDYSTIDVNDLNAVCQDADAFREQLKQQ